MGKRRKSFVIPERFLRQLWQHRCFSTKDLKTTDGKTVEIISPGKLNKDGGPDFLGASVRIGGILYRGEVEIHQRVNDWFEHRHHKDCKYNSVVLHVVLRKDLSAPVTKSECKRSIRVLALEDYLTFRYRSAWEKKLFNRRAERLNAIRCFFLNDNVDPLSIRRWLEKLFLERIELKIRLFEERLKELAEEMRLQIQEPQLQYGAVPFGINPENLPGDIIKYSRADLCKIQLWEQLLYERIMEAFGYSKNQNQFLKLADNLRLNYFTELFGKVPMEERVTDIEAIFFGTAGLLARSLKMDRGSKKYLRLLSKLWLGYSKTYKNEILDYSEWHFFRLRPKNFPTIRLAGAARLVQKFLSQNIFKFVIQTVKEDKKDSLQKYELIRNIFVIPANGFWLTHYRLAAASNKNTKNLIGKSRASDIVLNVIVPVCLLYARVFKDRAVRREIFKILGKCSAPSENTITKNIYAQLIKGKLKLRSAILCQGALQLYKFYCVEEKCHDCTIGKSVFKYN